MNQSTGIGKLATALTKAQSEMGPIVKDKTATVKGKSRSGADFSYTFDYADLGTLIDAVKPALNRNGIAILQGSKVDGDKVVVETMLAHESGEWISSELAVKPEDVSPQKVGGAVTYARRYALAAMVGVTSEEDDDGNQAQGNEREIKPRKPRPTVQRFTPPIAAAPAAPLAATDNPGEEPPPPIRPGDPLNEIRLALSIAESRSVLKSIPAAISKLGTKELRAEARELYMAKMEALP